jgi:hypothetical protein
MKKFLLSLIFVLISVVSVYAVDLAWDHDGVDVDGYVLYYEAVDGSLGPFNYTVVGGANTTATIPTVEFQPNVEYTFAVTAFNDSGESDLSLPVLWTRNGWGPPSDNRSSEVYVKPGSPNNLRDVTPPGNS